MEGFGGEAQRRIEAAMAADGLPPFPVTMPAATPVAALKNKTALQNQYTPEAARILYSTPTRVDYGPIDQGTPLADIGHIDSGQEGFTEGQKRIGYYVPDAIRPLLWGHQIAIEGYDKYQPPEEVLAHEFAHKWQNTQVPKERVKEWENEWPITVQEPVVQRTAWRNMPSVELGAIEAYAHNAEMGPQYIPPEVRGYHYPGLFQEGIGPQQPWPQPQLTSGMATNPFPARLPAERPPMPDIGQFRREYFSPQQWVPERGVAGYYASGQPIPEWNPPLPSMLSAPGQPYFPGEVRGG